MAKPRPYHHGDLRRAVLAAALDVIAAEGPGALSLRDLARRAGVSHAAPAHHFGDRAGLLTAIAVEGNELLAATLADAADLRGMGVRYVRFAQERPAYFQVMFQPHLLSAGDPELAAARSRTADVLRRGVATVRAGEAGPELSGVAAWSLAHGFATLLLSGALEGPLAGADPVEVFREAAGLLFR